VSRRRGIIARRRLAAGATPTYAGAGGNPFSSTVTLAPPWPVHAAGDIGLLVCESVGAEPITLTTPAGFAEVTGSPVATGTALLGTRLAVFWCRATSDAQSAPLVADPGNHVLGKIFTFRGAVASGDPFDAAAGDVKAAASTSMTWPTLTTLGADRLIILLATRDDDLAGPEWSNYANANLTDLTERFDDGGIVGNGGGIVVVTGGKATAGAIGATTADVFSTVNAMLALALKPAA